MKPTTIRLPEELLEELDEEASEHGFHTRTEYLRYLIDNRELVVSIALEQREDQIRALSDQVEELDRRISELEEARTSGAESPAGLDSVEELVLGEENSAATADEEQADDTTEEPVGTGVDLPEEPEPLNLRDPGPENIEQRIERLEFFAPTREIRGEREEAMVAAWRALVENKELSRAEFRERVFEEYPATFSTFDGWYDRLLVPTLDQLDDVDRVDDDTWRFVGP